MPEIRILIVEDDPFIAMDIETLVAERLGASAELVVVDSLTDAHAAVTAPLSCALLDIDVIGGKTFGVAQNLQASGTPFVFVSGSTPHDVPPELRDVRFLRKPFSEKDIVSFVDSAVAGV